ncbi:aspartate aminotransferase, partial [mine drainage metagenome]
LDQVRYDIRGPLSQRARELEQQGVDLLRINIGNPARFGLHPPAALREAIAAHLHEADAYGPRAGPGDRARGADRRRRGARHWRTGCRARIHRQRRQRADRHEPARAAG